MFVNSLNHFFALFILTKRESHLFLKQFYSPIYTLFMQILFKNLSNFLKYQLSYQIKNYIT